MTNTLKTVLAIGDTDKTLTLSLPDPKDNLTLSEVNSAMSIAITGDLITVNGVAASAVKKVYIHQVQDTDVT